MSKINIEEIGRSMLKAFEQSLESDGLKLLPEFEEKAKGDLFSIAQRSEEIGRMFTNGEIDKEQAKDLFEMQKKTVQEDLLTIEGTSVVLIQNGINAAINAVRESINSMIGWALL